jgi:hypothetical protein
MMPANPPQTGTSTDLPSILISAAYAAANWHATPKIEANTVSFLMSVCSQSR